MLPKETPYSYSRCGSTDADDEIRELQQALDLAETALKAVKELLQLSAKTKVEYLNSIHSSLDKASSALDFGVKRYIDDMLYDKKRRRDKEMRST